MKIRTEDVQPELREPSSFEEASKDPNWICAMNDEMNALYENDTWTLADLPYGRKPIEKRIDCEETFSLVIKMGTVRCLLSLAVQKDWDIFQMDVNNAFLYGDLNEEAHRQWNHKLSEALRENGFEQSKNDQSLFFKSNEKFSLFLLVYVDDIIITVLKVKNGLCLSQRKYCLELLHEFGLLACRPVLTPLLENIILAHKESEKDKFLHMHAPLKSHFDIALRLLKYLKLAPGNGIQYLKRQNVFDIKAFSDSDWAKCPVTRRNYRSMAAATCEIIWIVKVMKDLNIGNLLPAELHFDNKSAIQIAANPVMHEKTKHFDLDVHLHEYLIK
ncbi:ribonuclease H-like domain-containing protein, partial [Tanacetum coccineum]